ILDGIKDEEVPIARPVLACADATVFGAPFYLMQRIDGVPIRNGLPSGWAQEPATHGRALEQLIDTLVGIHRIDWRACGLGELEPSGILPRAS
ncbi:phosphotransferase, partial [Mycobacterium kansasii]